MTHYHITTLRTFALLATAFIFCLCTQAQDVLDDAENKKTKPDWGYLTIGCSYGLLSFNGDLSAANDVGALIRSRRGVNIEIEKRFGTIIGISANVMIGKIQDSEVTPERHANFTTPVQQFGINLSAHFDTKPDKFFAPFFSVGAGMMLFDPYGDLKDKNNNTYYYWKNGEIRDKVETKDNKETAKIIYRDYEYETKLTDSAKAYSRNTLVFPLTAGLKFRLSHRLEARLSATYTFTQTDYIDNINANGDNDKYMFSSASLYYTFREKQAAPADDTYSNVDFSALLQEDSDDDGVPDDEDECQHTPFNVKVGRKGCPLDGDKDGVPDYRDKELNTKQGAVVNHLGITMTDEMIERLRLERDSVVAERVTKFTDAPSKETLKKIDTDVAKRRNTSVPISTAMPKEFGFADKNADGVLQSGEITIAIDEFFEGEIDITVSTLLGLIDYFFEQ